MRPPPHPYCAQRRFVGLREWRLHAVVSRAHATPDQLPKRHRLIAIWPAPVLLEKTRIGVRPVLSLNRRSLGQQKIAIFCCASRLFRIGCDVIVVGYQS